jgi:phage-related protein
VHEKVLTWLGSSRKDIRAFPAGVRRVAGYQLWRVQNGLEPNDYRPMTSVGTGVTEIRIHTGQEHRILCVARFAESVYVLHAFEKRTRKTPKRDLDVAKTRLRQLLEERAKRPR